MYGGKVCMEQTYSREAKQVLLLMVNEETLLVYLVIWTTADEEIKIGSDSSAGMVVPMSGASLHPSGSPRGSGKRSLLLMKRNRVPLVLVAQIYYLTDNTLEEEEVGTQQQLPRRLCEYRPRE